MTPGEYLCGARVLRLPDRPAIVRDERFVYAFDAAQEQSLAEAGAIVIVRPTQPDAEDVAAETPEGAPALGPGDDDPTHRNLSAAETVIDDDPFTGA